MISKVQRSPRCVQKISSSSAGESVRRRRITDKQEASSEVEREKDLLSTDIRQEKLALQQNLYNIASSRSDIDNARTLSSSASGMGAISSINTANRASISDYYNRQLANSNSRLQSTSPGLFGQALGTVIGGPVGGILGPLF